MNLCLASLSTTVIDWRGRRLRRPTTRRTSLSVLLVLACFCVYLHVLWLFYSIEKNLLLLCGGVSKPVVHFRSLIYSLHCSPCVCSVRELISTVLPDRFCAWCNDDWNWVEAAFKDAHLRVWRATIKAGRRYRVPCVKATIEDTCGNTQEDILAITWFSNRPGVSTLTSVL